MTTLRKAFGGKCANPECGSRRLLQFAHLAPTPILKRIRGRGMPNRYYDIKRHQEAYVLLCKWCHWTLDISPHLTVAWNLRGGLVQQPTEGTAA